MSKIAVVFYSFSGNTRTIAEEIAGRFHADLAEIKTVKPYKGDYNAVVDQGKREADSGYCPQISTLPLNISEYDIVFLGTPVWWYTMAPAMLTFVSRNDFSGKKVIPFATNAGWLGKTLKNFEKHCSGAKIIVPKSIKFSENDLVTPQSELDDWLDQIEKQL